MCVGKAKAPPLGQGGVFHFSFYRSILFEILARRDVQSQQLTFEERLAMPPPVTYSLNP
jgi:hypothetical protein